MHKYPPLTGYCTCRTMLSDSHTCITDGFKLVRVSCRSDSGCPVISRNPPAFGFIMESWLSHGPHLTCWLLVFNLFLLLAPMSFSTVSPVSARI